jgi:hypothetical protein
LTVARAATAAVAIAAIPAAAQAETKVAITGHVTPVIRTAPKRPQPVSLALALHFTGDQDYGLPPILQRAIMSFPFGATLNSQLFPACAAETINRRGTSACRAGSQVGSGSAVGVGADVVEKLSVRLFNGPRGRSVVFYLRGDNPLRVNTAFAAPLERFRTGTFQYRLTVPVPKNLQNVAGVDLAVRDFKTTVRATRRVRGRRRGYIEALLCPPKALVPVQGVFEFAEAPDVTTDSYIQCG